jgi:hypothetical protein
MEKKYYKIVDGNLKSITGRRSFDTVQYKIGQWVQPIVSGSDLFIFSDLGDAKKASLKWPGSIIFECEVKNPRKKGIYFWNLPGKDILTKVCKLRKNKKKFRHLTQLIYWGLIPNGTMFCSEVKLIKRV